MHELDIIAQKSETLMDTGRQQMSVDSLAYRFAWNYAIRIRTTAQHAAFFRPKVYGPVIAECQQWLALQQADLDLSS